MRIRGGLRVGERGRCALLRLVFFPSSPARRRGWGRRCGWIPFTHSRTGAPLEHPQGTSFWSVPDPHISRPPPALRCAGISDPGLRCPNGHQPSCASTLTRSEAIPTPPFATLTGQVELVVEAGDDDVVHGELHAEAQAVEDDHDPHAVVDDCAQRETHPFPPNLCHALSMAFRGVPASRAPVAARRGAAGRGAAAARRAGAEDTASEANNATLNGRDRPELPVPPEVRERALPGHSSAATPGPARPGPPGGSEVLPAPRAAAPRARGAPRPGTPRRGPPGRRGTGPRRGPLRPPWARQPRAGWLQRAEEGGGGSASAGARSLERAPRSSSLARSSPRRRSGARGASGGPRSRLPAGRDEEP